MHITTDAGTSSAPFDQDHELVETADEAELVDEQLVGRLVKVTHFDTLNLVDVVQWGTVVDHTPDGVVVGVFPKVVGPLPLDPTCHERVDAPRVELVDVDEATADALARALTGA